MSAETNTGTRNPPSRVTHSNSKGAKPSVPNASLALIKMQSSQPQPPSKPSQAAAFFRRLSTKFRSSSPRVVRKPRVVVHGAGLPNYLVAKGNREAALRERGLLPPKDLSEQERDLDRESSIETTSGEDSGVETAAKRIKAEWEANNRQRNGVEQLDKFKLDLIDSESKRPEGIFALVLESVSEETAPPAATPFAVKEPDSPQVNLEDVTPALPAPSTPPHSRTPLPNLLIEPNTFKRQPWSIPLPPSPVSSSTPSLSAPPSPTIFPLDMYSSSPLASPTSPAQSHLESPQPPTRSRTKSAPPLPSLSESASLAPSSITTPSSSMDASCPPEICDDSPRSKEERQPLAIKTRAPADYDGRNIQMIVESPVDEDMAVPFATSPLDNPPTTTTAPSPAPRPRLFTDPGAAQERRRSFLGFKTDGPSRLAASRRSYTSMANLRSVVGSLRSRPPKHAMTLPSRHFDASRLPPSPTLPAPFARAPAGSSPPSPRLPLSPTIHSLGSILQSTRGIEDEESRRLSEMAFLD